MKQFHAIGDSHVSFFTGRDEIAQGYPIVNNSDLGWVSTVHYIGASTAAALVYPASDSRQRLFSVLNSLPKDDPVILVFGEIDCRVHLSQNGNSVTPERAAQNYLRCIRQVEGFGYDVYVWGAVCPIFDDERRKERYAERGARLAREQAMREFNGVLHEALKSKLINISGRVARNPVYFFDGLHLSQKAMEFVLPIWEKQFS